MSFGTRRVAESEHRRDPAVEHHDAFESAGYNGKMLSAGDVLFNKLAAAGDLNQAVGHGSLKPSPGGSLT